MINLLTRYAFLRQNLKAQIFWEQDQWVDAATTCTPTSSCVRDLDHNTLSVAICHLTDFAMFAEVAGVPTSVTANGLRAHVPNGIWVLVMLMTLTLLLIWQLKCNERQRL